MLIIGPRYNKKDPSKTGGIVVLFENWIDYCNKKKIPYSVIDTNKANYPSVAIAYFSILAQLLWKSKNAKTIFLHGTAKDYLFIAPVAIIIGHIFNKKIILRKFAGSFDKFYNNSTKQKRKILTFVLKKADLSFWETKSLTQFGKQFNNFSYWFPNIRNKNKIQRDINKPFNRHFIFLSQVRKEKGIDVLKESFSTLDDSYAIDIYGPINGYDISKLNGNNYHYIGSISPDMVYKTLSKYDALVLPTYWKDEGYPGIIIEAFSVGIPVIATTVGGIPEIVENGINGILIPPHDSQALTQAIKSINQANYQQMAANALESFKQFDADTVNDRIYKLITEK